MLCQRHYTKASIPSLLDKHLVACLRQNQSFSGWPLEVIVSNEALYYRSVNDKLVAATPLSSP